MIAEEEERLEEVLELHLKRDEAAGSAPLLFDDSESGERMRRYQPSGNRISDARTPDVLQGAHARPTR